MLTFIQFYNCTSTIPLSRKLVKYHSNQRWTDRYQGTVQCSIRTKKLLTQEKKKIKKERNSLSFQQIHRSFNRESLLVELSLLDTNNPINVFPFVLLPFIPFVFAHPLFSPRQRCNCNLLFFLRKQPELTLSR